MRVLEVCRKLNPEDSKVQKAYEMLKEVQAAESGESAPDTSAADSPAPASAQKPEEGIEKELPAAPFATVAVIQAAPESFNLPEAEPEVEAPKEKEGMSAAAFAAIPAIGATVEKINPPPPTPPAPVEEKSAASPFVAEAAVVAAAGSMPATPSPAFEPAPVEPPAQKQRRKRSWKWLLPAILISFVVFLCAGVSFIYIRQLFP